MTYVPVMLKGRVVGGRWPAFHYHNDWKVAKDGIVGEATFSDRDSAETFIGILEGSLPAREKHFISELVRTFPGSRFEEAA